MCELCAIVWYAICMKSYMCKCVWLWILDSTMIIDVMYWSMDIGLMRDIELLISIDICESIWNVKVWSNDVLEMQWYIIIVHVHGI